MQINRKIAIQLVLTALILMMVVAPSHAQPLESHKVFMFGNLADIENPSAMIVQFEKVLDTVKDPFTLVLNGDLGKN